MRIPEEIIEDIRVATDVVMLVGSYVKLKKSGANYFGLCPFHQEKTSSFSVNSAKQIWHCFGCNRGGNVFSFIMEHERVNFVDAVKILAERASIKIPTTSTPEAQEGESRTAMLYRINRSAAGIFNKYLLSGAGAEAREYLSKRGISDDMLTTFGMGLSSDEWEWLRNQLVGKGADQKLISDAGLLSLNKNGGFYDRFKGRIIFSIVNEAGKVVAFGGRVWRESDSSTAKYINSPETPVYIKGRVLYGLYQTKDDIRKANEVVFVEGYTDFLSVYAVGVKNVVASSGTALTTGHARLAKRYADSAILVYDGDSAGRKAAARASVILLGSGMSVKIAMLPDGSDPDSFAREKGPAAFKQLLDDALDYVDFRIGLIPENELTNSALKAKHIKSVVEELAELDDELVKSIYLTDFAQKFGVDETLLKKESAKLSRFSRTDYQESDKINSDISDSTHKAEFDLVMLLLSADREASGLVRDILEDQKITHPMLSKIKKALLKSGTGSDIAAVFNTLEEAEERAIFTKMLERVERVSDGVKLAEESLQALLYKAVERKIKALREKMKTAGSSNETQLALATELNELTKKRKIFLEQMENIDE